MSSTFTDASGIVRLQGSGPVAIGRAVLTNAQVLALPTMPVELFAAPGPGVGIIPIHATLRLAWTADYTAIDAAADLSISSGGNAFALARLSETVDGAVTQLLAPGGIEGAFAFMPEIARVPASAGTTYLSGYAGFYDSDILDVPLNLSANNGGVDFDDGDPANTLTVTMLYYLVTE